MRVVLSRILHSGDAKGLRLLLLQTQTALYVQRPVYKHLRQSCARFVSFFWLPHRHDTYIRLEPQYPVNLYKEFRCGFDDILSLLAGGIFCLQSVRITRERLRFAMWSLQTNWAIRRQYYSCDWSLRLHDTVTMCDWFSDSSVCFPNAKEILEASIYREPYPTGFSSSQSSILCAWQLYFYAVQWRCWGHLLWFKLYVCLVSMCGNNHIKLRLFRFRFDV